MDVPILMFSVWLAITADSISDCGSMLPCVEKWPPPNQT